MKKLDQVILREIFGPWFFGVSMFTVLLLAGSFLFQFTSYLSQGVPLTTVGTLMVLVMPALFVKTFPMATLLAGLLGFGRLSGESELTSMRAAGTSLIRIMVPVAAFGLGVTLLTFLMGEYMVPGAAKRATLMRDEIASGLKNVGDKGIATPVREDGKLTAFVVARSFDLGSQVLRGATVLAYDQSGARSFTLDADELAYTDQTNWRIRGKSKLSTADGALVVDFKEGIWPSQIPTLNFKPQDLFAQTVKDLDSLSMSEISEAIKTAKSNTSITRDKIVNLEFGYWNKIALPLAALVYALVGAPLGIRNHRSGAATGFAFTILIIFCYLMLTNVLAISAQGGAIPAWVASFTPVTIGICLGGWLTWMKNR